MAITPWCRQEEHTTLSAAGTMDEPTKKRQSSSLKGNIQGNKNDAVADQKCNSK
jgi:hypothetical protein